jgi:RNA polymerase sigma-70 factor (sigma-E family)
VTYAIDDATGVAVVDSAAPDLAELWLAHRPSLVRMAAVLLDDPAMAEDIVQDAYIRVCARPRTLRDPASALAYLRQTVVNLSRSSLRRRSLARRHLPAMRANSPDERDVLDDATGVVERDAMVRAVRALPRRMREAVTLRYYLDLTEAQAAAVMGVGVGSVKGYTSRGLAQLAQDIEGAR